MIAAKKVRSQSRRAYLLMSVLVCMAVVLALATAWLRSIALERQHLRADARGVQAELLAASGLSRAASQLAADADYSGETWDIPAEALQGRSGGTVTIHVTAADRPLARHVTVAAEFPAEDALRARRTRATIIELHPTSTSPTSTSEDQSS